jgi:hypothetical protein
MQILNANEKFVLLGCDSASLGIGSSLFCTDLRTNSDYFPIQH